MSLQFHRVRFTSLLCQLIQYAAAQPGISVALDEGMVTSPRPMWDATGAKVVLEDAVHVKGSFHHQGLATDLLLYRQGFYIVDGSDPIFEILDRYARSLDPWFGLGISFHDANHVSLGEHYQVYA